MKPGLLYGIIFFVVFLIVTAGVFFVADSNPGLLLLSSNKAKLSENSADWMGELGVGADGEVIKTKSMRLKLIKNNPSGEGYT